MKYRKGDRVKLRDGRTMVIKDLRSNGDGEVLKVMTTYKDKHGFNQTNWWRNMQNFSRRVVEHMPADAGTT